jgi:hypothetical protein
LRRCGRLDGVKETRPDPLSLLVGRDGDTTDPTDRTFEGEANGTYKSARE